MIAEACAEVGVRVVCAYGVTDRHGADGARRGPRRERALPARGGRGLVGVHAAFTCTDDTLEAAAGLAADLGVGVHVHVAEGAVDADAGDRLAAARRRRLAARPLRAPRPRPARHDRPQPAVEHEQRASATPPRRARPNRVALGTDGIGADMLEEFRLAYVRHREDDVLASPDTAWSWLENGYAWCPRRADDRVTWNYDHAIRRGTSRSRPASAPSTSSTSTASSLSATAAPTRVDPAEVRAKAAEQADRLFARL